MSARQPQAVDRETLYELVWRKPMIHAAVEFGISGNGLAKVCRKLEVPYPPRGYRAKLAAGKAPPPTPLPKRGSDTPASALISGGDQPAGEERPGIVQAREAREEAEQRYAALEVPERLAKPHPMVAAWIAEKKDRQARARGARDPWIKNLYKEADFTPGDRRRHRILHALFVVLEKEGGAITETNRKELRYERDGVFVEFQLREKFRQVRRPLTEEEKRWKSAPDKGWKLDLDPTGMLLFEFKNYSLGGLRRNWLEADTKPMEILLPGIVATFVAAIPVLVEEKKQREEAAERWRLSEQRRQEEEHRRRLDEARWRKFVELAGKMRQVDLAREFLDRIKASAPDVSEKAGTDSVGDWLSWADAKIQAADPMRGGAADVFNEVAITNAWAYRD